jgi:O-antigen/teichoic acid export membrane protein
MKPLPKNTFFMNALYLMLSTFVVAGAGLVFWMVVTRTHDVSAVGLATTLLSVSSLLSLLGLSGFDTTFVRFLPGTQRKNDYINSGFVVVTLASTILAIALGLALPMLSPNLSVLREPWAFISFVFFTAVTSLNVLTNAVFLAFKQAQYVFIINTLFSAGKVVLPVLFVGGNATTIFVLAGSAQALGLVLSIVWMVRKFGYSFSPRLHIQTLRVVKRFSLSVYMSSLLNLLPPTLLPLIIVYYLGPKSSAYYYMAFTIASVLYTIAYASMQSVLAEGSHNPAAIRAHVVKAAKLVTVLLVPAAIGVAILSTFLLTIFGHEYAQKAGTLLQLFAAGSLPVAVYAAIGAIFKVTKNLRGVIAMNAGYALIILGLGLWLVPVLGLVAIGWAWIIGNVAACAIGVVFLRKGNGKLGENHGTAP